MLSSPTLPVTISNSAYHLLLPSPHLMQPYPLSPTFPSTQMGEIQQTYRAETVLHHNS